MANYLKESLATPGKHLLQTHSWTIDKPKADLLLIHGYGEHAVRYEREAAIFNKAGFNVFAYDQKGHGLSDGKKGFINNFQDFIDDLEHFIKSQERSRPYFFYAHSMGALLLTSFLLNKNFKEENLIGVLMTAPFLMPDRNTAPLLQKLAGPIGKILPKLKTVKIDSSSISKISAEVDKYNEDPLVFHDAIHARTGGELLAAQKKVQGQFENFKLPLFIQHGAKDRLAEVQGAQLLHESAASEDKKLRIWPKGYHELTRDEEGPEVLELMVKWMKERI